MERQGQAAREARLFTVAFLEPSVNSMSPLPQARSLSRQRVVEDGSDVSTRVVSTPRQWARQWARGRVLWYRQTSGWCPFFTTGLWTSTCKVAASGCFPSFLFGCRGNFAGTYQRPFTTMASCRRGNGVHLVAAQQPMACWQRCLRLRVPCRRAERLRPHFDIRSSICDTCQPRDERGSAAGSR